MLELLLSLGASILLLWVATLIFLKILSHRGLDISLKEGMLLLPETIKLFWRLLRDRNTPRRARVGLLLVFLYLISPLDIVPDFIPGLGLADEILVLALGMRFVVKHAGVEALDTHWTGTASGLIALKSMAGVAA